MRVNGAALLVVLCLLLPGCTSSTMGTSITEEDEIADGLVCNGLAVLCERTYDNVTFPETHNAFATHEDGIYYPASNHRTGLGAQWDAGMRAFMLDTHYADAEDPNPNGVRFCHGDGDGAISPCIYGSVDAVDWLSELNGRMAEAPSDVVTLLIENYVQPSDLAHVLEEAELFDMAYIHQLDTPWPTLRELIENNHRLVVFWEQATDEKHPYFHDFLTFGWTTDYAEDSKEEMDCSPHRGDAEQEVYHMNNWLSGPFGLSSPNDAEDTNDPEFLIERSIECWEMHGKRPTFIAVDWWEDGDVVAAALAVNQMELNI